MADVPVPLTILRALADETRTRLALAPSIEHPGESGRAREQTLMAFIEQLIPSSFGVSTGFVVDALGGKSRQIDVVVYLTDYHPVLEIGRVKHFPVESVMAVIEVKAAITTKKRLTEALGNIASVKALDRINRRSNARLVDRISLGGGIDQDEHNGQIFGAIVTEKSLAGSFSPELLAWLAAHPRREWPNVYADVHRFSARYRYMWSDHGRTPRRPSVGPETMLAESLAIEPYVAATDSPMDSPLVILGRELINWFRVVPRIDFNPLSYFPIQLPESRDLALLEGTEEPKEDRLDVVTPGEAAKRLNIPLSMVRQYCESIQPYPCADGTLKWRLHEIAQAHANTGRAVSRQTEGR